MSDEKYISTFRNIIDDKIKKNEFIGFFILVIILTIIISVTVWCYYESDMVTNNITYIIPAEVFLSAIGFFWVKKNSKVKLELENLDSRDMSKVFDSDHPLALDALTKTRETGYFTYADLSKVLAGYEKIYAATQYAETGLNKTFKVSREKPGKGRRMAYRGVLEGGLSLVVMLIPLVQLAVASGFLPTVNELLFNQYVPTISFNFSIKEIVQQILIPKAITIALLHGLKIGIKQYIKQ